MARPLASATATGLNNKVLPLASIIYLDILNDPLFAWSGVGDLVFTAGQTGDPLLDGVTFSGTGNLIEVSAVSDGIGGSDTLEIALPGVDITQPILRQLITNRNRWQFRRAVVWMMLLDETTYAIVGKPFRIKTGRMDKMPLTENKSNGIVKCAIEGQAAYGNTPLGSRYSEQIDLNPSDISQTFVHSLANMSATLGQASSAIPGSGSNISAIGGSREYLSNNVNIA